MNFPQLLARRKYLIDRIQTMPHSWSFQGLRAQYQLELGQINALVLAINNARPKPLNPSPILGTPLANQRAQVSLLDAGIYDFEFSLIYPFTVEQIPNLTYPQERGLGDWTIKLLSGAKDPAAQKFTVRVELADPTSGVQISTVLVQGILATVYGVGATMLSDIRRVQTVSPSLQLGLVPIAIILLLVILGVYSLVRRR